MIKFNRFAQKGLGAITFLRPRAIESERILAQTAKTCKDSSEIVKDRKLFNSIFV